MRTKEWLVNIRKLNKLSQEQLAKKQMCPLLQLCKWNKTEGLELLRLGIKSNRFSEMMNFHINRNQPI